MIKILFVLILSAVFSSYALEPQTPPSNPASSDPPTRSSQLRTDRTPPSQTSPSQMPDTTRTTPGSSSGASPNARVGANPINPSQNESWMKDQDDQTDTYAIPLDTSEEEEKMEERNLERSIEN